MKSTGNIAKKIVLGVAVFLLSDSQAFAAGFSGGGFSGGGFSGGRGSGGFVPSPIPPGPSFPSPPSKYMEIPNPARKPWPPATGDTIRIPAPDTPPSRPPQRRCPPICEGN